MSTPGNAQPEQQAKLSGGRWLTTGVSIDGQPAITSYEIEVPSADTYTLWVRKFWKHDPFRWRFADQDWQVLGRDVALLDQTFLEQFWGAYWVRVGEVTLPAGETTFTIEMPENNGRGAIDCFLLTTRPFTPRGKLKPGSKSGDTESGHFAWEPDSDPFDGSAPISLRHLNESRAGVNGFLQREDNQFLLGDGSPGRFWMVQANLFDMSGSALREEAKRMAKYGINLVRVQLSSFFNAYARGREGAFENQLRKLHRVVAALKAEGIYTYIGHLYWHTHNTVIAGNIPGLSKNQNLIAAPFLSPEFKQFYLDYLAALLTPASAETGLALKDEPALGFIEIMNESSLLFHTFNPKNFSEFELAYTERAFADWCAERYGSLDAAKEAWGKSEHHTPDRVSEGRLGPLPGFFSRRGGMGHGTAQPPTRERSIDLDDRKDEGLLHLCKECHPGRDRGEIARHRKPLRTTPATPSTSSPPFSMSAVLPTPPCATAGRSPPPSGKSLLPVLLGENSEREGPLFFQWKEGGAVIEDGWKIIIECAHSIRQD